MMRATIQFLGIFATIVGAAAIACVLVLFPGPLGWPFLLVLGFAYGWVLFAYFHYRQGRQEEFVHLLSTAVEAKLPLAPVLRAYVRDRPHGRLREFWVGTLLFFVIPGYYWLWYRRHRFDRKVGRVAHHLEEGASLHQALQAVHGVVSRETVLTVAVGEATGQLALCLRGARQGGLITVWLEMLPRLLYPLVLLCFVIGITGFWIVFLLPKVEKIFHDFHEDLPLVTAQLADAGNGGGFVWVLVLGFLAAAALLTLVLTRSSVRWHLPVLGRFYRMNVQSRMLRMLALLVEAGKPMPEALAILAGSGAFAAVARRRLEHARRRVEQGEPLADSLHREGLVPQSMVPLVQAAERMRNLSWALTELGAEQANRAVRLMRRISLGIFSLGVCAVGLVVGFIALGMFLPLIKLLERLSI